MSFQILQGLTLALLSDWITSLSLVFFGCCSNAITLEQLTSQYPHSGTLITFFQFLIISLSGLPKHITFSSPVLQVQPDHAQLKRQKLLERVSEEIATIKSNRDGADHRPLWVALDGNGYESGSPVLPAARTSFGEDLARILCATDNLSGVIRYTPTDLAVPESVLVWASPEELQRYWLSTWTNPQWFPSYHSLNSKGNAQSKPPSEVGLPSVTEDSVILVDIPRVPVDREHKSKDWWDFKIIIYETSPLESYPDAPLEDPPNSAIVIDLSTSDAVILRRDRTPSFHTCSPPPDSHSAIDFLRSIPIPRLRPRRIPLAPYLVQVGLFYLISLLNNAAFGYSVPMSVHIIFRSGGLIVSMLLGRVIVGKRYTTTQIISVSLVTLGVLLTTLSASKPKAAARNNPSTPLHDFRMSSYTMGIVILSLALILSGFLGLVQDWTYKRYSGQATATSESKTPTWQESMFYLHFLAMPMFLLVRRDLVDQINAVHSGPKIHVRVPFSAQGSFQLQPTISLLPSLLPPSLALPAAYVPLLLNTFTQLVCVAGVHRLTTRVSSLTVTLVLVVRKAVSLVISVVLLKGGGGANPMMWGGAALVLIGTVGYTMGAAPRKMKVEGNGVHAIAEVAGKGERLKTD